MINNPFIQFEENFRLAEKCIQALNKSIRESQERFEKEAVNYLNKKHDPERMGTWTKP